MTPNFFLLNISSLALISLLALFAWHNKKVGWAKTRRTYVEDLQSLQEMWDEDDRLASLEIAPVITATTNAVHEAAAPIDAGAFAAQLANLQNAVNRSVPQVAISECDVEKADVEDAEFVAR
jgi:hypothetical protein